MAVHVDETTVPKWRMEVRVRAQRRRTLIATTREARELDSVASLIWRHLDGTRSIAQLADLVCEHHDVDRATAVADIAEFVRDLAAAQFVDLAGAS